MEQPQELCIRPVRYCEGKTKTGKRCCFKVQPTQQYCPRHAKLFRYSKPDECPICNEPLSNVPQPLSCGHWVHRGCLLKWKDQCPVCRAKVDLTKRERAVLERHAKPSQSTEADDFTDQAIASIIRQDMEARGIATDTAYIHAMDLDEDMDMLSSLVVSQVISNLTNALSTATARLSNVFAVFPGRLQ